MVEDTLLDFASLQRVLEWQKIRASCTRVDSDAALDAALARGDWDAAIVDFHVPGMTFDRTVAALRRDDPLLPVILLTGTLDEEQAAALLRNSLDDFVMKERPARLASAIRMAMERARVAREAAVRSAELRIAAAAFESQEGMLITNTRGVIERVNRAFTRITGYAPGEAIGRSPEFLRSGLHGRAFYAGIREQLREEGFWLGEIINRYRDGSLNHNRLSITAVRDEDGNLCHYVATLSDIGVERAATARAEHLTYFDVLTELPNRRLVEERIDRALALRPQTGGHAALLQVGLDHFKVVNDVRGHNVGDSILVEVASRLRLLAGERHTVGRFTGDAFLMLVEDLAADPARAARCVGALAERIRQALAQPYRVEDLEVRCTASIGITLIADEGRSAQDVMQEAEIALYRAKQEGRDRACLFEQEMQRELSMRSELEFALHGAAQRGEFVLYYQLQILADGTAVGAEALIRWNHPGRGMVAPGEFIALAEESGAIDAISDWVLDEACAQLARWARQPALRALSVAVNVSPKRLRAADFVAGVLDCLRRHEVEPSRLELELTEGSVIEDIDDSIVKLEALRRQGIRISIDDFGTGNSSFSYLTRLPLDQIKIDRAFIMHLPDSPRDAKTARAIIALGKELDLEVIAEGVETQEQAAYLRSVGCELFQGFYFGGPVPVDEFERRLVASGPPP